MKRLIRSKSNRMLAGVCAGFGEYFEIDPTVVRVAVVLLCIVTGLLPFVVGYIVCMLLIPDSDMTDV